MVTRTPTESRQVSAQQVYASPVQLSGKTTNSLPDDVDIANIFIGADAAI
jgi:hypothetical protein